MKMLEFVAEENSGDIVDILSVLKYLFRIKLSFLLAHFFPARIRVLDEFR